MLSTHRPLCFNDRTEAHIFTWQSLSNVLILAVQLLILLLAYLSNILQYSPSLLLFSPYDCLLLQSSFRHIFDYEVVQMLLTMRIVWYLSYRVTKQIQFTIIHYVKEIKISICFIHGIRDETRVDISVWFLTIPINF